ncbi:hypothetical protein WJX75_004443 [Coccomyxa subellipsoidea]|uniref:Uncharacterized protein n=1 Tax=Coccomyxa subellipsoidea TaxID=248742 RepID=A0ABR2YQ01_9CHLO
MTVQRNAVDQDELVQAMIRTNRMLNIRLVASPSEAPQEEPRGFILPGERIRNPRDAILSSAPPERTRIQGQENSQPAVESRKRSISLPEPATSAPMAQAQRGERGTAANAEAPLLANETQAAMPEIKTQKPATLGALEIFTPSPPRLAMAPSADRWGESKIPRSPLAKSTTASSANALAADAGTKGSFSPSKLPSPGAVPPSPKRKLTPCATSAYRSASPLGESRIPKPRTGANANPETRKQRYAPRASPERSSRSGSSAGGRSSGRPRSAKPKPKLADLEKGWVGNDVPLEDGTEDGTFHADEALKLAEELSAPCAERTGSESSGLLMLRYHVIKSLVR